MNEIRCLLVDDEPPAIELLLKYTGMIDQLNVVSHCHSAVKAFEMLRQVEVDLIFLDIRMPVLNGLDFIKSLKSPPAIILTTAYREYALDGYDLDIVDYLLKPISFDRFLKAVDRYRSRISAPAPQVQKQEPSNHIFVNINKTHHKIVLNEILYIESLKDYVRIHTKSKEKLVVKGNIGSFMEQLPQNEFVRIHRSFAVAISQVDSYNQAEVKIKGNKLPIGSSYRNEFLSQFQ